MTRFFGSVMSLLGILGACVCQDLFTVHQPLDGCFVSCPAANGHHFSANRWGYPGKRGPIGPPGAVGPAGPVGACQCDYSRILELEKKITMLNSVPIAQLKAEVCSLGVKVGGQLNGFWHIKSSSSSDCGDDCGPESARLNTIRNANSIGGWVSATNEFDRLTHTSTAWIQVEMFPRRTIRSVVTQGIDGDREEWVTSFKMKTGNDTVNLRFLTNQDGSERVFQANTDNNMALVSIEPPVSASVVRIYIQTFHGYRPVFRFDLLNC